MALKPILVGMNNPLSPHPRHALYPDPPGCTGYRLWQMLAEHTGATKQQYLEVFERTNILHARKWSRADAEAAADGRWESWNGREVVVLGDDTRRALALPDVPLILPQYHEGVRWRRVPHPSGRNHWYNSALHRIEVGLVLEELYTRYLME
jgi:hypothetical protein